MYDICSGLRQLLYLINTNVKRNPNPNPNPNFNPYPTSIQKPNHYPNFNSLLWEMSSQSAIVTGANVGSPFILIRAVVFRSFQKTVILPPNPVGFWLTYTQL